VGGALACLSPARQGEPSPREMASRLGVARAEHGLYTAEHLRVLDEVQTPVWMLERGEGSKVVWNNHAFLEIFGKSQSVVDKGQWHPPMPPSLKVKHQQIHGEVELVEDGGSFSNSRSNGECSTSGRGVHMVSESGMIPVGACLPSVPSLQG